MNRLLALLLLTWFAPPARAGWTALTLPVAPEDVNVWSPGEWSISAGAAGAFGFVGTNQTSSKTGVIARGTALTAEGCLAVLSEDGQVFFSCPDGTTPASTFLFDQGGVALRSTPDGGAYALQNTGIDVFVWYLAEGVQPGVMGSGASISGLPPNDVLAVHRAGGLDSAAFGRLNGGLYYVTGTSSPAALATTGEVDAIALFGTASLQGLFSTREAGAAHVNFAATPPTVSPVELPTGLSALSGVSYELGTGSAEAGDGFGMAIAHGNASAILSALPSLKEAEQGRQWRVSAAPPAGVDLTGFTRIDCIGARFCVAIRPVSGEVNVLLYENAAPPELTLSSTSDVVAPGAVVQVSASATDADGDAVRLSWRHLSGPAVPFSSDEARLFVDTSGADACVPLTATFEAAATDGLAAHEQRATYTLTTTRAELAIGEPSTSTLQVSCAGLREEVSLLAVPNACSEGATFLWTQTGGPPLSQAGAPTVLAGRTVTLELLQTDLSQLVGQRLSFDVVATDPSHNTLSREVSFALTAEPFLQLTHTPNPPLAQDGQVVEVKVAIKKPGPCALTLVDLEEELEGLELLEDSVTQNGRKVEVEQLGERRWRFHGVELPHAGSGELRFLARKIAFQEARITGRAVVAGVPLSSETGWGDGSLTAGSGCAAATSSGVASWGGLVLLAMTLLRRAFRRAADVQVGCEATKGASVR